MAMLESPPQLALVPHAALGGDCCYGGQQQQQQQQQQASSSGVVVAVAVAEAARPGEGGEGVAVGAARPVARGTKRASGTRPPRASGTRKRASGARAPRAGGEGAAKSSAAGGSGKPARSSRYRGVAQHKVTRRWESHIWHDKRQCYLGSFDTEEDAAVAYDQGALRLKGREKAALNFPERDYSEFERETQGMGAEEAIAHLRRASSGFCRGQAKYRGVSFRPATKRWEARMSGITSRKYTYLGTYDSAAEAAAAYDRAAIACKGKEAMTNFAISNYSEELGALAAASKSSLRSNDGRPSRATVAALNAMSADYFDKEAERKRKVAASTPESARKRRRRQAEERKRAGIARGAGAFGAFGGINRDGGAFRLQESPRRGHAHGLESQQQAGELHAGGLVHNPFGGSAGANVLQPSARVNLNAAFDQGGNPASPRRLLSYSSAPPPYQQLLAATLPILGSPVAPHGGMPFTQAHVAATLLLTPPGHGDPVTDENRGPLSANIIRHEGAGAHLGMPPGNAAAQAKAKRRSSIELFPAANAALHGPERDGNGVLPPSGSESPVPHLSDHSTGCGGGAAEMQQPSAFAEVSPIPVTPADHQPPHDRPGFGGDAQQGATNAGGSGRRGNACAAAAEQPVPVVWDELFQAGGGSGNAPQPGTARSAASAGDGGRADANANDSLRLPGDASLRSLRSLQSLRHLSSSFQESQFSKLFPRESSKSLMMGVDATAFEETLRVWQDNADEMKTPLPGQRASATNAATPGAPPAARQATSGARAGTQATGEDSTPAPTTAISGAHTNAKTPADLLARPTPFRAVPSGRKLGAIPNADEIGSAVQAWGETPGALRTPSSLRDLLRVFEAEGTAAEERG